MTTWPASPTDARLVIVDWYDIAEIDNWNAEEEVDAYTVTTAGWLLENSPQRIVIASTYRYEDDRWSGIHVFPRAQPEIREAGP